jgi:hypothetical protein
MLSPLCLVRAVTGGPPALQEIGSAALMRGDALAHGAMRLPFVREEFPMRIGWVGGLTRSETQLERLAANAGHRLEFHSGHVGGRGAGDLRSLIERVDFVVIVTDINSHGAVIQAKRLAQRLGRGTLVIRSAGVTRFQALLDALATREAQFAEAVG